MTCLPLVTLCAFGVIGIKLPDPPLPNPAAEAPAVLWQRGERSRQGKLDAEGNFVPSVSNWLTHRPGGSGPSPLLIYNHTGSRCVEAYEYRSGAIIRGIKEELVFVPEYGSVVVSAAPYIGPGKPDRLVYNRPESVADFWTPQRRRLHPSGLPAVPPPPRHDAPPDGWQLLSLTDAYPFQFPDGPPLVARVMHEIIEFGQLDGRGEFVPDYRLPVMQAQSLKPIMLFGPTDTLRVTYTLPTDGKPDETVYEYRSGRLIKGVLHKGGNFAPEIGSTVRAFKEYKPGSDLRIYNLHGVLKPTKH